MPAMPDAEDVRRIALSLPDTTEKIAWSMPTFRVAGKMFATLPEDETSIAVRCPKEERDELALAEPEKFWIADHEAQFAWVRVRLAALEDEENCGTSSPTPGARPPRPGCSRRTPDWGCRRRADGTGRTALPLSVPRGRIPITRDRRVGGGRRRAHPTLTGATQTPAGTPPAVNRLIRSRSDPASSPCAARCSSNCP